MQAQPRRTGFPPAIPVPPGSPCVVRPLVVAVVSVCPSACGTHGRPEHADSAGTSTSSVQPVLSGLLSTPSKGLMVSREG